MKITRKAIEKARDLELDIHWFARTFLTAKALRIYDGAIAEVLGTYDEVASEACRIFDEAVAEALCKALGL